MYLICILQVATRQSTCGVARFSLSPLISYVDFCIFVFNERLLCWLLFCSVLFVLSVNLWFWIMIAWLMIINYELIFGWTSYTCRCCRSSQYLMSKLSLMTKRYIITKKYSYKKNGNHVYLAVSQIDESLRSRAWLMNFFFKWSFDVIAD